MAEKHSKESVQQMQRTKSRWAWLLKEQIGHNVWGAMACKEVRGQVGEEMTEGLAAHGKKCGFYSWCSGSSRIASGRNRVFLIGMNRSNA